MEKELAYLGKAITNPARPFVAILGGAKVSDKIEVVENLMKVAEVMLIGGGMAYTFLKAKASRSASRSSKTTSSSSPGGFAPKPSRRKFALLLPVDHVVGAEFKANTATQTVSVSATPDGWMGLDIGPRLSTPIARKIASAKTIVWNGPMGVFEMPRFAKALSKWPKRSPPPPAAVPFRSLVAVIPLAAVHQAGVANKISHISTGGGASLEFLADANSPRRSSHRQMIHVFLCEPLRFQPSLRYLCLLWRSPCDAA